MPDAETGPASWPALGWSSVTSSSVRLKDDKNRTRPEATITAGKHITQSLKKHACRIRTSVSSVATIATARVPWPISRVSGGQKRDGTRCRKGGPGSVGGGPDISKNCSSVRSTSSSSCFSGTPRHEPCVGGTAGLLRGTRCGYGEGRLRSRPLRRPEERNVRRDLSCSNSGTDEYKQSCVLRRLAVSRASEAREGARGWSSESFGSTPSLVSSSCHNDRASGLRIRTLSARLRKHAGKLPAMALRRLDRPPAKQIADGSWASPLAGLLHFRKAASSGFSAARGATAQDSSISTKCMSQGRSLDMQKCHVFHSVSSGEAARARGSDTTASFGATQWGVTPLRGASGCAWKKTGSQTFVEGSVSSRKAPRDGADIKKRGDRGHYSAYDGPRKRELPEAAPSDKVWLRCSRNDCDSVSGSGDEGRGSSAGAIRSDGSSPVATATGGVGYVGSIRAAASEHLSLLTKCPPLWPALLRLTSKPRQDEKVVCRELQVLTLLRQAASSMTKDVEELPPLCRAHIHVAHFMEDDVLVALAQHPLQDEALHLKWRGIATRPLLVHASLEITNDDVCGSVAGRGASLKVYDIALAVTGSFAALRLKCAEGWITAECVDMSAWQGCCQCRRRNFCHMWTREIEWERRDEECCKPLWGSRIRASRGPRRVPHTTVAAKSCHRKQPPGAADAVDVARREASGRRNDATRKSGPRAMLTAVGVDFEGSVEADEEDSTEKECGRQLLVGAQRRTHRNAVGSFLRLRSGTKKSLSVSSDSETARNRRSRTLPDGHGHEKPETVGRVRDNWDDGSPQKFRQTSEDEERECSETAASSRRLVSQLLGCGAACSVALGVPTGGRLSGCRIFNRRRRSVSTVRRRESSNPVQAIRVKERKCSSSSIRSETASERGCVAGFARKGRRCGQPPTRHRDAGSVGVRDIRRLRKTCGQKGGLHGACRLLTREVVQVWARAEEGWYRTDDEARVQFPNGQPEWWKDAGIWGNYRRHNSSCYLHDCEGSQEITLGNSSGASSQSSEQQCWCHRRCSRLVERWCRGPTKRTLNSCSAFDAAPYNRRQMCKQGRIRRFTCGNEPLPSLHGDSSGEQEGHEISTSSTTTAALGRGLMSDDEVRDLSRSQQSSSGVGNRSNHRSPGKIGVTLPAGNAGGITPWLPAVSDGLRGDPGASVKASTLGTHRQGEEAPRPFRQRWLLYRVCGRNTVPVGASISPFSPTIGFLNPGQVVPIFDAALAVRFCCRDSPSFHKESADSGRCCSCCNRRQRRGAHERIRRGKLSFQAACSRRPRSRLIGGVQWQRVCGAEQPYHLEYRTGASRLAAFGSVLSRHDREKHVEKDGRRNAPQLGAVLRAAQCFSFYSRTSTSTAQALTASEQKGDASESGTPSSPGCRSTDSSLPAPLKRSTERGEAEPCPPRRAPRQGASTMRRSAMHLEMRDTDSGVDESPEMTGRSLACPHSEKRSREGSSTHVSSCVGTGGSCACCSTSCRMIVLRLRTTIGWVSMRRLSQDGREREIQLEKVDEAEEIFKTPQLYQVIADGYLLNVRQGLEIEGPVVRTLPPATQVEVFERRMNNEGLMRLRLSDGWISERRRDPDTPVHTFTSALAKRFSASLFGASSFSSCGAGVGGSGADAGGRGGSVVPTGTGRLFAVRVRDTREITRKRQLLAALAAVGTSSVECSARHVELSHFLSSCSATFPSSAVLSVPLDLSASVATQDGARQRWRESHSPWCRVNSLFQVEEVGEGIGELCEIRIPRNLTCGGCENFAGLDSRTLPRRNNGDRFADKIGSHRAEPTEESQSSGYGNSSEHGTWGRRSALVSGYKRFCNHVTPDTAGCCSPRQEEPAVRQRTLKSSKAHISVDRKRQMASHDRSTHRSIGEKRSASDECRRAMRCCTKYPGEPEACGRILATSLSSQGRRSWSRAEKRGIACPCSLVAGDGAPGFQPHDDVMASTTSQSLRGSYIDFGEGSCNILDVCFQDASCAETAPDSNSFSSVTRRVAPMQAYSKCAISNGATGCGQSLIVTDNERDGSVLHGLCYTPIQPYAARDSADTLASAFVVNSVQDSVRGEQLPEAQRNLETACTGRQHGERTQRSKNILLNGRSRGSGDVESLPVVPVASDDPGVQLGNRGWEVTQGTDTERRAMLCGRCHWTVPVAGLSTVSGETQFGWDPREMKENGGGDANCSPQQERTNGSQSSHAHGGVWHTADDGAVNSSSSLAQALRTLFSPLAFISLSGSIHRTPNTRVAVVAGMNITRSGDSGHCHGMRRQEHAGLPHHNLRTYKSQIGIQTDCRIGESERIVGVVNGGTPLASDTVRVVDGTEGFLERPNDTGKRSLFASEVSEIFGGCAGISDAEEEVPFGLCAWAGSGVGSPAENPIFRDGSVRAMTTRVIGPAPRDRFCHNTGNRLAAEAAFNFLSGAGTRRRLQSVGGSRTTPAVSLTRAFFDHEDTTSSPHGMRHPSQRRCRSCASHAALPCPSGGSGDVTSRLEASDVVAGEDADDNNRTTPSGAAVSNRQDCCRSAARSLREPTETQASCGTRNYGEHPYTYTDSCDSRPVTAERRLHGPARIRRTAREESDIGGGASEEEPSTSEEREDTPRGSVEAHGASSISCQDDGRLAGSGDATGDAGAWAERALTGDFSCSTETPSEFKSYVSYARMPRPLVTTVRHSCFCDTSAASSMIGAADGCRCSCSLQESSSSCIHSGPQSVCGATGYPACRLGGSLCTSSHSTCGGRATDQAVFLGREAAASVKLLTEVASALPHYPRHGHALAEQQLLLLERQQRFRCAEHESEEAGSGSGDGKWCVGAGASPGWRGGGGMCSNTALSGVARGMDKWGCSERAGSLGRASGESPGPAAIQQTGGIERTAGNDAGVNQSERGRLVGGMCGSLGSLATNLGVYREVLKPGDSHYSFCLVALLSSLASHRDAAWTRPAGSANSAGASSRCPAPSMSASTPGPLPAYGPGSIGTFPLNRSKGGAFVFHPPPMLRVCKIERLHNPLLLQRYLHERESMMLFKGNRDCASVDDVIGNPILRVQPEHAGTVNLNEFFLFHGCKANRAELIAVSGFDCRRAGENRGKLFGVGTYFSPLASKADLYSRSPQDSSAPPITSPKPPLCGGSAGAAGYSSFASPSRAGGFTSWGSGGGEAAFQRKRNALSGASGHVASGSTSMGIGRRAPKTPKNDKRRSSMRGPGVLGFASCALQKAGSTGKAKESDPRQLECFYPTMCSRPVAGRGECMACMRSFASVASGNSAGFDSCGGVLGDLSESSGDDSRNESRGRAHADERDLRSGGGHLQTASDTSVDGGKHGRDRTQEQPKTVVRTLVLSRVCLGEVYKATRAMPEARMPPAMADPGLNSCSGAGGKGPAYMLGGGGCGAAAASCTPGDVAGSTGIPGVPLRQEPQLVHYDSVMAESRTKGGVVDSVEFVVFERGQALPLYCITYTHDPACCCASCYRCE